jgi:hypothetical protein
MVQFTWTPCAIYQLCSAALQSPAMGCDMLEVSKMWGMCGGALVQICMLTPASREDLGIEAFLQARDKDG